MTNSSLKCTCKDPASIPCDNKDCVCATCGLPIQPTTEPKCCEKCRNWNADKMRTQIYYAIKAGCEEFSQDYVIDAVSPLITTLLHSETESAMLRQRNYDQKLIDNARAEERQRIVKMCEKIEFRDKSPHELLNDYLKRKNGFILALDILRDKLTNTKEV